MEVVESDERAGKEKARKQILIFLNEFAKQSFDSSKDAELSGDVYMARLYWSACNTLDVAIKRIEELSLND